MKKGLLIGFYVMVNMLFGRIHAQEEIMPIVQDTINNNVETLFVERDTLTSVETKIYDETVNLKLVEPFKPNPTKAVIYSAIFPGLGQIYNKKYWKLPIVYGGFMGVLYGVTWNGNMYNSYRDAYRDIMLNPRIMTRWHDVVGGNIEDIVNDESRLNAERSRIKRQRDYFRRNRDLAIIVGVGLYALSMIDAYVDAHLHNFTISPDLSMSMAPVIWGPSSMSSSVAIGFQCNIVF